MKKLSCLLWMGMLVGLLVSGCDALSSKDEEGGMVILTGQVLNEETNNPVPNAFVRVLPFDLLFETDAEGQYSIEVEIDSTMDLQVRASKDGFTEETVTVLALAERTIAVPILRLNQTVEAEPTSGQPSNILLLGQSAQSIGVKESGAEEVASITFQVADSMGRPVVLDNQAQVNFRIAVGPGGGEFIFPTSAPTDNNGQATVNLSSGTRAGVVQIESVITLAGRTIRSKPVAIAIHGGLPDLEHFTLASDDINFPGLVEFGQTNGVGVILGDKYSNPVKPGTAVYFKSTHAVIGGSTLTDEAGQGGVTLTSANPLPLSNGIGVVTAETADENQQRIFRHIPVVFSGTPVVTIEPAFAALNQTYLVTITDGLGNPLAPGNNVSIRVEGTLVKAAGTTNTDIFDTPVSFLGGDPASPASYRAVTGPGLTEFTFRAVEDLRLDEAGTPEVETITVRVSGPNVLNGTLELTLTAGGAATRTEGAVLRKLGNAIQLVAPEK